MRHARNELRGGKEKIPVVGILGAYKQLQVPAAEEGFDELHCVSLNAQNQFIDEPASDVNLTK